MGESRKFQVSLLRPTVQGVHFFFVRPFQKLIKKLSLDKFSIQHRVLLYFITLIFIPTILILVFIYHLYLQFMIDKVQLYTYQMVREIDKNIDSNLTIYSKLSMQIYANKEIIENLKKTHVNLTEQFNTENAIRDTLRGLINSDRYVTSAYLITTDRTIYADGLQFPAVMNQIDYYRQNALAGDGRPVWLSTEKIINEYGKTYAVFKIVREIKSIDGTVVGVLILLLREDLFSNIYQDVYFGENAVKYVLSRDLTIVSCSNEVKTGLKLNVPYLKKAVALKEGSFIQRIGFQKYLVVFSTSQTSQWQFVSIIPLTELLKEVYKARNVMLLLIVLFLVFLFSLLYLFSNRITLPLKNLVKGIKKVEQGRFDISVTNPNQDEIGELSRSFESMVHRVRLLVEEVKEKEALKSKAEIEALESQINPHFMYNTLNSIKWMAVLNKQENIKNMIDALIILLKNTVKGNQGLVTIREEIELLKSYIFIQSIRFTNFKTVFDIQDEILGYKLMKFTLQPIIENSIIHGFSNLAKTGEITISIAKRDFQLLIIIRDNGIGIKEDEIDQIMAEGKKYRYNKVGLMNVHDRIVLNYGNDYGLKISSVFGEGTTVEITLPILI